MTYKAVPPTKNADRSGFRAKRFWVAVAVVPHKDGFAIHLDHKPVKTPKGQSLFLPDLGLAQAVAAEWEAVGQEVEFSTMPLTRLGFASIDQIDTQEVMIAEILRYAKTDLLSYPSDYPKALVEREQTLWQPWLLWADTQGLSFTQIKGLTHKPQSPDMLLRLEAMLHKISLYERTGLYAALPLLGSVILALAMSRGHVSAEAAHRAANAGAIFQAQTWGEDPEAKARNEAHVFELRAIEVWFKCLRLGSHDSA
jgi:chaperone required for assembly of F1-ATPase